MRTSFESSSNSNNHSQPFDAIAAVRVATAGFTPSSTKQIEINVNAGVKRLVQMTMDRPDGAQSNVPMKVMMCTLLGAMRVMSKRDDMSPDAAKLVAELLPQLEQKVFGL